MRTVPATAAPRVSPAPVWRRYLRFWGPNVAEDVDDELRFHVDMLTAHYVARGMAKDEARERALARFGDSAHFGAVLRAHDYRQVRSQRRRELVGDFIQDVRIGLRGFRRSPAFAIAAVLTLALGIGANAAIFSVVDAVLLRPLPYPAPERLVSSWGSTQAEVLRIGELARSFESVGGYRAHSVSLSGDGDPERVDAAAATAGLFRTLGTPPLIGRSFTPQENEERGPAVAMISHELWSRRFGGDRAILGRQLIVNGKAHEIIGVMPPGFGFPARTTRLWIPLVFQRSNAGQLWGWGGNRVIARLAPGATPAQAELEVQGIARRLRAENPVWNPGPEYGAGARVVPLHEGTVSGVRPTLVLLLGVVGCVLLIACANVANLLLVRAAGRRKEMAIRSALGGGRGRLVRQLLTESMLLSGAGAVGGIAIAWAGLRVLTATLPPDIPRAEEIGMDMRVLGFTAALAVITGVIFGLIPAMRSAGLGLPGALSESGRSVSPGRSRSRMSSAIVIAEVAISLVLLASAGLLIRSFVALTRIDPGFSADQVIAARVSPPERAYAEGEKIRELYRLVLEQARTFPGTTEAAAVSPLPLRDGLNGMAIRVGGQFEDMRNALPSADHYALVTPGYMRSMGIPLVSGRDIDDGDRAGAPPVVLVSESLARQFWPGRSAVGERIGYPWPSAWMTIVGVVGDVKQDSLTSARTMAIYRPFAQAPIPSMSIVIRTSADASTIAGLLRESVRTLDATIPVSDVTPMTSVVSGSMARPRFAAILITAFAAVAMILGAIGIYGVIAYAVAQRTREIGVRMALGATPGDAVRIVVRRGAVLTLAGLALGTVSALAASRLFAGLLHGISPTDPVSFVTGALLLALVAVVACYIPARRATRVDPTIALRAD